MSLTIRDCLKLPSLSIGEVVAGGGGLNNIVTAVSVAEFENYDVKIYTPNELLLTALYSVKDSVSAQCRAIEEYKRSGDVGMVLFYSDIILKEISVELRETADRLNFPIIALPGADMGVRYSDVIGDVMEAVFMDRKNNNFFVNNTMERISQLSAAKRNIGMVLSFAAEYGRAAFFLCDEEERQIAASHWPPTRGIVLADILTEKKKKPPYDLYKIAFINKNGTKLILYGVSQNNRLNMRVMNEVVEVIQLFSAIWNYNLNLGEKEAFIPALLENDLDLMNIIAQKNHFKLSDINTIMLIQVETEEFAVKSTAVKEIRRILEKNRSVGIADLFGSLIAVVGSYYFESSQNNSALMEISSYFDLEGIRFCCSFFDNLELTEGGKEYYLKHCRSINSAQKIYPLKNKFSYSEIKLAERCDKVIQATEKEKQGYRDILKPITNEDQEDLLLTLSTYMLDADLEVNKTAELLFIHRNTVQYRLTKGKRLIGIDFSKMPMQYEVYFAVALKRIV